MYLLSFLSIIGLVFSYNEVNAQQQDNVADSYGVEFLSVQTSQAGSVTENNTTSHLLELNNVANETVLFSDRPDRIIESISTSDFIGNWTAGPDSFAEDPPNAVLIYENLQTGNLDTVILELFNPLYDMALNTLTYSIIIENAAPIDLQSEFGKSILVVDTTLEDRVQEVLDKLRPFN